MMDEKIIELRNEKRKSKYKSIYDGVYIKEELVEFEERKILNERMSMWIPKTFIDMPVQIAKIKYPNENRPQVILTDLSTAVNFTFNIFDMNIRPDQIEEACKGFKIMIKSVQPSNVFFEEKTQKLGDTMVSWFDYKSPAIDAPIYNIVYVTSIENKVVHGIFNCLFEDMKEWSDVAKQAIMSIKDLTEAVE